MPPASPLESFGSLVTQHLRDASLHKAEKLLNGTVKAPSAFAHQEALKKFSSEQLAIVRSLVRASVDSGIHDFLFKLQELSELGSSVQVLVNGQDVAKLSDGLHGEAYSGAGWYARFSAFPAE
jgi:chromosome condensin MukBEF complex kleisin-like MukF subunit